jgi:hypothetical protein
MTRPDERRWRKSSTDSSTCVELHPDGAVRDSKHPHGPVLRVELAGLLRAAKAGEFDR